MARLGQFLERAKRSKHMLIIASLAFSAIFAPWPTFACGPDSDCTLGDRTYRVRMPIGHDGKTPVGAILFVHGFRGSASAVMKDQTLGNAVSGLGLALIAPSSRRVDWSMAGSPITGDDEIEYFTRLLDDVNRRFSIDRDQIMAAGFSSGAMMVWSLACSLGEKFAGFTPVSGTFWEPMPKHCDSPPANLFHVHGAADGMVPLGGRMLERAHHPHNDRSARQGNVRDAIAMYARYGKFSQMRRFQVDGLSCERQTNPDGLVLELCLHRGGHRFDAAYLVRGWTELLKVRATR